MTRKYLVVFEKGARNWSAFSPDVPGCGSMGADLDEARTEMRTAIELYLRETAKAGETIPEPVATSVDFEEFDPRHETKQYMVEWLQVTMPKPRGRTTARRAA